MVAICDVAEPTLKSAQQSREATCELRDQITKCEVGDVICLAWLSLTFYIQVALLHGLIEEASLDWDHGGCLRR